MQKKMLVLSYFMFSLFINSQTFATDVLDLYGRTVHAGCTCCYEGAVCAVECAQCCGNEFSCYRTPRNDKIAKGIIGASIAIFLALDSYQHFTKDETENALARIEFDKGFQQVMRVCNANNPEGFNSIGMSAAINICCAQRTPVQPKRKKIQRSLPRPSKFLYQMPRAPRKCFDKHRVNGGRKK